MSTRKKRSDAPDAQNPLDPAVSIVTRAAAMTNSDLNRAVSWFRSEPLAEFDHKTAEQLVSTGHAEAVETHLDMLEEGIYS
jgi:hypothetical protein